jgi:DNA-binding PucR family transcriptional regulator
MLEVHQRAELEELKRLLGVAPAAQGSEGQLDTLLAALAQDEPALGMEADTYRLLIGVLLHNPEELRALRASTIAPLEQYDALHDTDLAVTLENFLAHHGSTTDTAEAMQLHRHTVGYRLTRIQEVSGLSPYESEGRERLSLGLKARRILLADAGRARRASERLQRGGGPAGPAAPETSD